MRQPTPGVVVMTGAPPIGRSPAGRGPDAPAEPVAVDPVQVAVEDLDVVRVHVEPGCGGQAVVRDADGCCSVQQGR